MDPLNDSVVLLLQNSGDQYVAEMWKNGLFGFKFINFFSLSYKFGKGFKLISTDDS